MRTLEKNFTYLLLNVIPHRRLVPERRRSIKNVLSFGHEADIRREAVLSLEELVGASYLQRESVIVDGDRVAVTYSRSGGGYRIRIHVPVSEWNDLFPGDIPELAREPAVAPEPGPVDDNGSTAVELFPKLIRTFAINERNGTLLQKLDSLLGRFTGWFGFARMKLYLREEQIGETHEEYRCLATVPENAFKRGPLYDEALSADETGLHIIAGGAGLEEALADHRTGTVSIPIYALESLWGILEVEATEESLDSKTRSQISAAAETVRQVIENSVRLENLVSIDKLTRIYNRHFYDMQIPIEVERATRSGNKLSMLILDLDDFKIVNDKLGHQKGDEALVIVADLIRKNLRKIDLPFRYGGEEFVILLPGTAQLEAIHTAERLRSIVEQYSEFRGHDGEATRITVSIGIGVFPDHASTSDELFECADKAMYKAKKLGKNRVEVYKR